VLGDTGLAGAGIAVVAVGDGFAGLALGSPPNATGAARDASRASLGDAPAARRDTAGASAAAALPLRVESCGGRGVNPTTAGRGHRGAEHQGGPEEKDIADTHRASVTHGLPLVVT
jgi:hypothetical protein